MKTTHSNSHEQRVRALCDRFGLTLVQRGEVWIIAGRNATDIRTSDLSSVRDADLDNQLMQRTQWARARVTP